MCISFSLLNQWLLTSELREVFVRGAVKALDGLLNDHPTGQLRSPEMLFVVDKSTYCVTESENISCKLSPLSSRVLRLWHCGQEKISSSDSLTPSVRERLQTLTGCSQGDNRHHLIPPPRRGQACSLLAFYDMSSKWQKWSHPVHDKKVNAVLSGFWPVLYKSSSSCGFHPNGFYASPCPKELLGLYGCPAVHDWFNPFLEMQLQSEHSSYTQRAFSQTQELVM